VYSVTNTGLIYKTDPVTGASTANGAFGVSPGYTVNGLALGQAGDYIWAIDQTTPAIMRYDASTGTTSSYAPGGGITSLGNPAVAAAIDPSTGIFYYIWAPNPATGVWYLDGFDTNTNTGIGLIATIYGMGASINGDIAFDAAGNLYITSNANLSAPGMLSRVTGPLPTTRGNVGLTATPIASNLPANAGQYNSLAFGPNGELVIGTSNPAGGVRYVDLVDPATGALISQVVAQIPHIDMASCVYPNTMRLQKNLPQGRYGPNDQFTLSIGNVSSSANTATTTGTATGIQSNGVGPLLGRSGQTYTISETAASGSLGNYTSTWSCIDQASGDAVLASGTGTSGSFTMPASVAGGAKVLCTFTNTALPTTATVTLTKQVTDVNGNNPTPAPGWTLGAATTATTGTVTASPTGTTGVTGANGSTAPWTLAFGSASSRASVAVSETQQPGYTFRSGSCTVTPATGILTTYTLTSAAPFSLTNIAAGAAVVCTYVNQPTAGTISWQKVDSTTASQHLAGSEWTLQGPGSAGATLAVKDCTATPCTGTNDTDPRAGYISVGGLAWGSYTLTEAKAPAGYVLDTTPRTTTVGATALTVTIGALKNTQQTVPALPLTGGVGADSFLIAGGVFTVLALALAALHHLRRRRRP
jgi:LPXTG-motif cell wall-anchored protein